ncbi:lysophospholipid acyltransferase family protein [Dasania marina]|uniref:lysophospholipid acyltransferase family protein n=1 Tax=Dasania marina TaxID=471499 RepID=UPI0030D7B286|tara:strand:+ start:39770 stop:40660 length:891 start_codon:yes stop_codon:yes gene_type:complete
MKSWLSATTLKLFALFPLWLLRLVGNGVGYVAWLSNGRSRQITAFNIGLCFNELSPLQQRALVKQSMRQLGVLLLEMGPVWRWRPERLLKTVKEVSGYEHIEQAEQTGKGTILIVPHLGSWEMVGVYLGKRCKVTALYQPPEDPRFHKIIHTARYRTGITLAPTNMRGVKALLKALKAGESVAILPDQTPAEGSGEFADFYGQPTYTMTLVHTLIKRTGARVVSGVAKREGLNQFHLQFQPAPASIYSEDMLTSVAGLNECVEACVQLCPEQYQWEYNRFKLLPGGQRRNYRDSTK